MKELGLKPLLLICWGVNLGVTLFYLLTHVQAVLILPLLVSLVLIARSNTTGNLIVILSYLSVEGCMKLFSGAAIVVRLGIDFLIMFAFVKTFLTLKREGREASLIQFPFKILYLLHLIWILVQFLNPHSLGLLASFASYKVYISSLLLFALANAEIKSEDEVLTLARVGVALMLLQVVTSIWQFRIGESGLIALDWSYGEKIGEKFTGIGFRPFGTSNVPGGGSTFLFLMAPFFTYLGFYRSRWIGFAASLLLLPAVGYVFLISQIRASLIKGLVGMVITSGLIVLRKPGSLLRIGIVGAGIAFAVVTAIHVDDPRVDFARKRFAAVEEDPNAVWAQRSKGVWTSFVVFVQRAPLGIGLSRVGAASEPFHDQIVQDTSFGPNWSFADNLYKALLIEVGLPGLFLFGSFVLLTMLSFPFRTLRLPKNVSPDTYGLCCATSGLMVSAVMGHLGSEGFLYQPESGIVWLFAGATMKLVALAHVNKTPMVTDPSVENGAQVA